MAGFGDLVVGLKANTTQFERGIRSAQSVLGGFASAAKSMVVPLTAAFATAGVAVYGLTGRIAKLAAVADKAQQTGLSGAFLQRLEYAADQSGVSAELLTTSIKKLTVNIGAGSKAFAEIGMNIEELQRLSPEQQFRAVAEQIGKIPTAAGRANAATKIFGRGAIEMTGLFAGGMNSVNDMLEDARKLGIGLSDDALAKAAAADDSIQRMYSSFGALFDQLAIGVAPLFDDISRYITEWIPPVTEFFAKFNELPDKAKWIGDTIAAGMDVAFETIKEKWASMLADLLEQTKRSSQKIGTGLVSTVLKVVSPLNPISPALDAMRAPLNGMNAAPAAGGGLAAAQARFGGLMNQLQAPPAWQGPIMPEGAAGDSGGKLKSLLSGFADVMSPKITEAAMAAGGIIDRAKLKANWWGGLIQNAFTGERPEESPRTQLEPKLAGAMQRGSVEAYSTLVNAMVRTTDPQVKATEKSAAKIVKAIKDQPKVMFNVVNDLMGALGL